MGAGGHAQGGAARGADRVQAGTEALCGRVGVVRRWSDSAGQVFVDGALWRARHEWADINGEELHEGDRSWSSASAA